VKNVYEGEITHSKLEILLTFQNVKKSIFMTTLIICRQSYYYL